MISWRSIVRGAVTRFIPGTAAYFAATYAMFSSDLELGGPLFIALASFGTYLTLGYVATLGILRKTLHPSAHITGRRSFFAGLASVGLLVVFMIILGESARPWKIVLTVLASAFTTLVIFNSKSRASIARLERNENGQLYSEVLDFAAAPPKARSDVNAASPSPSVSR